MKQLLILIAIGLPLAIAAPAFADVDLATDECGADVLQGRTGESVSDTNAGDLVIGGDPVSVTAKAVRVVGPDDAMTMDFRSDRLTIETDGDGNLVSAQCV